jgi:hypothetical protein
LLLQFSEKRHSECAKGREYPVAVCKKKMGTISSAVASAKASLHPRREPVRRKISIKNEIYNNSFVAVARRRAGALHNDKNTVRPALDFSVRQRAGARAP